jgi:hypothetical protein
MLNEISMAVVAAVNDDECLAQNLAESPMLVENNIPLLVRRGYKSAALAYNDGIDCVDADIVIFAHQDVYFPRGWEKKLLSVIRTLELQGKPWGVLGVVGVDAAGNLVGGAWSNGLQRKIESNFNSPAPVRSFDEIVLILRKNGGLRFDGPVIHNSLSIEKLGPSYRAAYHYMQRKWKDELPVHTLILPIVRSGWPLIRNWLREKKKYIVRRFKHMPPRTRHKALSHIAQNLGYE